LSKSLGVAPLFWRELLRNEDGEFVDSRGRTSRDAFDLLHYPTDHQRRAWDKAGKLRVGAIVTVFIESRGRANVKPGLYPAVIAAVDNQLGVFLPRVLGEKFSFLTGDDWFSKFHYQNGNHAYEWRYGVDLSDVQKLDIATAELYLELLR